MKKVLTFLFVSFIGFSLAQLIPAPVFAETPEAGETSTELVTLAVHELIEGDQTTTSDSKEETSLIGLPVSIYDLTSFYQEAEQQGTVDTKKFSEEWSEKALKGSANLGMPLATETTNALGLCTFTVPLKINQHYAVYLLAENHESTGQETGKTVPTVLIFPVVSPETGELLNPVEVYPKYVDGVTPEKPTPEEPASEKPEPEKPATPKPTPSGENYPSTNEATSSLSLIGAILVFGTGSIWYFNRRKVRQKNN